MDHLPRRSGLICLLIGAACLFAKPVQLNAQCSTASFYAGINIEAAGSGAGIIASGDFNGDGRIDLVVPHSNTISVILGTAAGPPTVVLVTSVQGPGAVGVADFNHDGKADLAVSHAPSFNATFLAVLLGDGAGGFGPPTDYPASHSQPLVIADFNNDGNADVFLGNVSTNNSEVLLGNGGGGFSAPFTVVLPNNIDAVAADFNNDGKVDLATVYDGNAFVSVALGDGTGHFGSSTSFSVASARSIATADLNNDGKLDLVTAGQSQGVAVLLGNGSGSFGAATILTTGFSTVGVAVGDLNGDGKPDVAATGQNLIAILLGDGNGGASQLSSYVPSESAIELVTGDLDGDGKLDLASSNCFSCGSATTVFFGDGSGKLRSASVLAMGSSPFSIASGDLNNDGKIDLAIANINQNNVSILLANGSGGFAAPVTFAVGNQPRSVALGDLNGDQKLDLVTANFNSGTVSVLLGDGLGGLGPPSHISVPGFNPEYATIADINNDGVPDLVVAYLNAGSVSILLGNGAGAFGPAANFTVPFGAQQVVVNDFNGDGNADLAVATISGVSVLLGNGVGGFGAANTLATPQSAGSVVVADLNGDGRADLATVIGNTGVVLVYLGNGQGGFGPRASFKTGGSPNWIVAADYNGDGNTDLATANLSGTTSVLLGDGAGSFAPAVNYVNGGSTTRSITSADFNSDGRPDLALANQAGSISVIMNACSANSFSPSMLSVSDTALTEGDAGTVNATFNVSLSAASNKTVAVSVYTAAQDSTRDVDYLTTLGRITFLPGTTSQTITVPVIGDALDEFDEQFNVLLAYPLNAGLNKGRGQGTILDNDPPPTVSIGDVSVREGNSGTTLANFTLTLSVVSGKPIAVQYDTMDGSATSGSDYVPKSGIAMIPAGAISTSIAIQVNGDTILEPDETFFSTLSNPVNVTIAKAQGIGTILNDDAAIQFDSASYTVNEGLPRVDITLTRSGDTTSAAKVNYATNDSAGLTNCNVINGVASPRCDYTNTLGTMSFAAGEVSKSFSVAIVDDAYSEGTETFTISLNNPSGAILGVRSTATATILDNDLGTGPNPIDNTNFFVRQQYIDFLGREPDPPGFAGWSNTINNCAMGDTNCDRIHVSQLFFQSAEFQERGYFVYRFYPVAFGRKPDYAEFVPDLANVSGFLDATQLEAAKVAFIAGFMARPTFVSMYNSLSNTQYVDTLLSTAAVTLPAATRQAMINGLNGSTLTRAQVLRQIVESNEVSTKYNHQAYAVMEYFGYLRRQPDAFYLDWIKVLDQSNDPRGMVTGFATSQEYRNRFGP